MMELLTIFLRTSAPSKTEPPIDLAPFCYMADDRPYLRKPFSVGDWTYATNAHVAIRVPRRAELDAPENPPVIERVFGAPPVEMAPLSHLDLTPQGPMSVGLGDAIFDAKYIRLLLALPELCVAVSPHTHDPMPFRFRGGEGRLMPMRTRHTTHIVAGTPDDWGGR